MRSSADEAELSGESLEIWSSVATLLERLPAALDAQLQADSGLTHFEYGLMYALSEAPERTLRMSTLAGFANSTLSRLSRGIARLEKNQWVYRQSDPSDGRYTLALLTDSGAAKVELARPGHEALVQRVVFGALTKAQARQLSIISERICASISSVPAWKPSARNSSSSDK
ncbi:MarR family winged helix-turn-helix transcriptional regulator [Glutamicibacter endophyticus]